MNFKTVILLFIFCFLSAELLASDFLAKSVRPPLEGEHNIFFTEKDNISKSINVLNNISVDVTENYAELHLFFQKPLLDYTIDKIDTDIIELNFGQIAFNAFLFDNTENSFLTSVSFNRKNKNLYIYLNLALKGYEVDHYLDNEKHALIIKISKTNTKDEINYFNSYPNIKPIRNFNEPNLKRFADEYSSLIKYKTVNNISAKRDILNILDNIKNSNFEKAYESLIVFTKEYNEPELTELAYYLIGEVLFYTKHKDNIISVLVVSWEDFLLLYPESWLKDRGYFLIAKAYVEAKNDEKAIFYYTKLINEYPKSVYIENAIINCLDLYLKNNNIHEATKIINDVLKNGLNNYFQLVIYYKLGLLYYNNGLYAGAFNVFNVVLRIDNSFYAHNLGILLPLAETCSYLGKYGLAKNFFLRYINFKPQDLNNDIILFNLGLLLQNEDKQNAVTYYKITLRDYPYSLGAFLSSLSAVKSLNTEVVKNNPYYEEYFKDISWMNDYNMVRKAAPKIAELFAFLSKKDKQVIEDFLNGEYELYHKDKDFFKKNKKNPDYKSNLKEEVNKALNGRNINFASALMLEYCYAFPSDLQTSEYYLVLAELERKSAKYFLANEYYSEFRLRNPFDKRVENTLLLQIEDFKNLALNDEYFNLITIYKDMFPESKKASEELLKEVDDSMEELKMDLALDYIQKFITIFPYDEKIFEAYVKKYLIYVAQGDLQNAIKTIEFIEEKHPNDLRMADLTYEKANLYLIESETILAIKTWETFLEKFSEDNKVADVILLLAKNEFKINSFQNSLMYYEMFLNKFPEDKRIASIYLEKARIERFGGEYNKAYLTLNAFLEQFPNHPKKTQAEEERAGVLDSLEKYGKIFEEDAPFKVAVLGDAAFIESAIEEAKVYLQLSKSKEALRLLEDVYKQYPDALEKENFAILLANLYKTNEEFEKWALISETALRKYGKQLTKEDFIEYLEIAKYYINRNNIEAAKRNLDEAFHKINKNIPPELILRLADNYKLVEATSEYIKTLALLNNFEDDFWKEVVSKKIKQVE